MSFIYDLFNKKSKNEIISVQKLTLRTMNMRVTYLYKIEHENTGLKFERYREVFIDGDVRLELERRVSCTIGTFVKLMNDCNVMKWDGFHGKHPKNVSDGTMFTFSATVNNGQVIRADGSENFPKGYRELVRAFNEMLEN